MNKLTIWIIFFTYLVFYDGVNTYKDVETLSDLGSLINVYITSMTAIILIAFGIDEIRR